MSKNTKNFILGIFEEEGKVLEATRALSRKGIDIEDVYTPYAVHGLDEAMGIKRSRLPLICFFAGGFGGLFAIFFQIWAFTRSWPMVIGGKPFNALPAFIPVSFEMTVLLAGLVTTAAFLFRSRLFPGIKPVLVDSRVTDHRFVIAIEKKDASLEDEEVRHFLKKEGAAEVWEKEVSF